MLFGNKHIKTRGWVRIGRFCGSHDVLNYRGVPYNVEMLKFMVRTHLPTVIADSWVVITLAYILCHARKCILVHLMAVNPEKYALALMEALFIVKKIASSYYCVTMKQSKKNPLPMEKNDILKCICFTPPLYRSLRTNGYLHFRKRT